MERPRVKTPYYVVPSLDQLRLKAPTVESSLRWMNSQKYKSTNSLLFDYNNKDQTNSFADVLGKTLSELVYDNEESTLKNGLDAVGTAVVETAKLVYGSTIKPVLAGRPDALLNNMFINFMETIDVVDNVARGALLSQNGPMAGIKEALLDRQNFEFNTGHLSTDILSEFLASPTNLITFGTAGAAKALLKKGASETFESISQEIGTKATKKLFSRISREFDGDMVSTVDRVIRMRNIKLDPNIVNKLKNISIDKTNMTVLKVLKGAHDSSNAVDNLILKSGFNSTLGMLPYIIKNGVVDPVRKYQVQRLMKLGQATNVQTLREAITIIPGMLNEIDTVAKASDELNTLPKSIVQRYVSGTARKEAQNLKTVLSKIPPMVDMQSVDNTIRILNEYATQLMKVDNASFRDYAAFINRLADSTNFDSAVVPLVRPVNDVLKVYDKALNVKAKQEAYSIVRSVNTELDIINDEVTKLLQGTNIVPEMIHVINSINLNKLKPLDVPKLLDVYDTLKSILKVNNDPALRRVLRYIGDNIRTMRNIEALLYKLDKATDKAYETISEKITYLFDSLDWKNIVDFHEAAGRYLAVSTVANNEAYALSFARNHGALVGWMQDSLAKLNKIAITEDYTIQELNELSDIVKRARATFSYELLDEFKVGVNSIMHELFREADITLSYYIPEFYAKTLSTSRKLEELMQGFERVDSVYDVDVSYANIKHIPPDRQAHINEVLTETYNTLVELSEDAMTTLGRQQQLDIKFSWINTIKNLIQSTDNPNETVFFIKQLSNYESEIKRYAPPQFSDVVAELESTLVMRTTVIDEVEHDLKKYMLQRTNFAGNEVLYNNEAFLKIIEDFNNDGPTLNLLQTLMYNAADGPTIQAVINVLRAVEGIKTLHEFYLRIDNTNLPDLVKTKMLEVMQSYRNLNAEMRSPLHPRVDFSNLFVRKLREAVESEASSTQSFSLDNFVKQTQQSDPQFNKELTTKFGSAHMAQADVRTTARVYELLDPKGYKLKSNNQLFSDIETTGMNPDLDEIIQIAVYNPQTDRSTAFVVSGAKRVPQDSVLRKLFGTDNAVEARALYESLHMSGNHNFIKEYYARPNVDVVPVNTAVEALELYQEALKVNTGSMARTIPVFHNKTFDLGFINTLADRNGMRHVSEHSTEDTLALWRAKYGVSTLESSDEIKVRDLLNDYIDMRKTETSKTMMDANTISGKNPLAPLSEQLNVNWNTYNKFVVSIDDEFKSSISDIIALSQDKRNSALFSSATGTQLVNDLSDLSRGVSESLIALKTSNDALRSVRVTNKIIESIDVVPTDYSDELFVPAHHINTILRSDVGTNIATVAARTLQNNSQILDWFDVAGRAFTDPELETITRVTRRLQEYYNIVSLEYGDIDELIALRHELVARLKAQAGNSQMYNKILDVLNQSKETNEFRIEYAKTKYLFDKYKVALDSVSIVEDDIVGTTKAFATLGLSDSYSNDTLYALNDINKVISDASLLSDTRYFTLNTRDDLETIRQFNIDRRPYESLADHINKYESHGITTARLKTLAPIYEDLHRGFDIVNDVVGALDSHIAQLPESVASGMKSGYIFSDLREVFDRLDQVRSDEMINYVLDLEPEHLQTYLWNYGKMNVMFDTRTLSPELLPKLKHIYDNKDVYSKLGINLIEEGGLVLLYLDKAMDYSHIKYEPLSHIKLSTSAPHDDIVARVNTDYAGFDIEPYINQMLDAYRASEEKLYNLDEMSTFSTHEKLDDGAFAEVLKHVPQSFVDALPSVDDLIRLERFSTTPYNHSILGQAKYRRVFMPFASFNPMKNLHASLTMLHSRVDDTVKYAAVMFDDAQSINSELFKDLTDDSIAEYIRNQRGAVRLAYLKPDKKKGYVVKAIHINSAKDVEFARHVNAVPMTIEHYIKTVSILNQNRVAPGLLSFLDHYVVAPIKVSYLMLREGFVLRNILDSTLKNVASAENADIVNFTWTVGKQYMWYKDKVVELTNLAKSKGLRDLGDVADIMKETMTNEERELFELIHRFKVDGPSAGLTKELQEYYGDTSARMYRNSGAVRWGIDEPTFRRYLDTPIEVVEAELMGRYADPIMIERFKNMRHEYEQYRKAYVMLKHTHNRVFDLETLVRWLDNEDLVPPQHYNEFLNLKEKLPNSIFHKTIVEKMMDNPLVKTTFDLNSFLEEVFRLTNYLYHIKYSKMPSHAAIAEVIRTHFDYSHRSTAMLYTEMLMPFASFKMNNFLFWLETFMNTPQSIRLFEDTMGNVMGFENYSVWDIENRRTLQYQMFSGNVIVNRDNGVTMKLSPSVMDTIALMVTPVDALSSGLIAPIKSIVGLVGAERDDDETEEAYQARIKNYLIGLVPGSAAVTNITNRFGNNASEKSGSWLPALFSSIFNYTNLPKDRYRYKYLKGKRVYLNSKKYSKGKRYKPKNSYAFNKIMYGVVRYRFGKPVSTRALFSNMNRTRLEAFRLQTKRGNSKLKYLGFPTNKYTLHMRNSLLHSTRRWK